MNSSPAVPEPVLEGTRPVAFAGQDCYGITHSGREWVRP